MEQQAKLFAEAVKESMERGYEGVVFFDTKGYSLNMHYARVLNAEIISSFRMAIFERGAEMLYDRFFK